MTNHRMPFDERSFQCSWYSTVILYHQVNSLSLFECWYLIICDTPRYRLTAASATTSFRASTTTTSAPAACLVTFFWLISLNPLDWLLREPPVHSLGEPSLTIKLTISFTVWTLTSKTENSQAVSNPSTLEDMFVFCCGVLLDAYKSLNNNL